MVQMGLLISDGILALGLRHVFEACRMGCAGSEKMLTFGTTALGEFVGRLHQWCEPTHGPERTHPNRQSRPDRHGRVLAAATMRLAGVGRLLTSCVC